MSVNGCSECTDKVEFERVLALYDWVSHKWSSLSNSEIFKKAFNTNMRSEGILGFCDNFRSNPDYLTALVQTLENMLREETITELRLEKYYSYIQNLHYSIIAERPQNSKVMRVLLSSTCWTAMEVLRQNPSPKFTDYSGVESLPDGPATMGWMEQEQGGGITVTAAAE